MIARLVPGSRGGRWLLLIGLLAIGLGSGLLVLGGSRVVLVEQPLRDQPLDRLGAGVYAQSFRAEVPGLTRIDFTITSPRAAPPPRLRVRLRELPEGPERVNLLLTPLVPGRHGYVTVRFSPLPAPAGGGYEFSLEREDATGQPPLQLWGAGRDAYPGGAYRRNGAPVPDRDMTFVASFRTSSGQALGVLERRLTAERPAPWSWSGTYVALLLLYGLALGALFTGLSRTATPESPGPGMSAGPLRRLGNILALLGANVAGRLLTLLYVMVVARVLEPDGFGQLVTATAYLMIFGAVTDFGVTVIAVRDIARDPGLAAAYLRRALVLRGTMAGAAYLGLGLVGLAAGYPVDQQRHLWVGGLALFPMAATGAFTAILTAREQMARVAGLSTLGALVMLVSAWPVLAAGWGVAGLLGVLVLVNALQAGLAAGWVLGSVRPVAAGGERAWLAAWRLLQRAWPYGCFTILTMVYLRVATIVLSMHGGPEAVGLYNAAFKLVEALTALPLALMGGLFPLMAAQSREGVTGPLGDTYRNAVRVLGVLALPVAVGVTILAAPVIEVVYGSRYGEAAPVLRILVWGLALLYLNAPVGHVIFSSDQGRRYLPWALANTGGYAALTVLLVARHGILGAAVGFVVAEATGFAIQLRFVRTVVGRLPSLPAILWRPAIAATAMAGALDLGLALGVLPLLLIPVGALVYGAILALLGEVRAEDRAQLRAWLVRSKSLSGGPLGV